MKLSIFGKLELIIVAIVLVLTIFMVSDVAYATDSIVFTISTTDGLHWILSKEGTTILEANGSWSKEDNVDELFSTKIDDVSSGEDYKIVFDLPNDLICSFTDSTGTNPSSINTNPYTELADSNIFVTATYNNYVGGITLTYFEYKKTSDLEYRYAISQTSKTARFGMNVDVGSYDIRATVFEEFTYKGKEFRVERNSSNSLSCTINTSSDTPIDPLTEKQLTFTYGNNLYEISNKLSSNKGTYSLVDDSLNSVVPVVSNISQDYVFNYHPANNNYEDINNITLSINIIPKEIEVMIGDAQIKCGEKNIDLSTYPIYCYVRTPLENGDSEDDLQLSLYFADKNGNKVDTIDTLTYGLYLIKAQFGNNNYKAISVNNKANVYQGGRYFIFPIGVEYETDDFIVSINRLDGFENTIPKVIDIDKAPAGIKESLYFYYNSEDKHICNASVLYFEEQNNYSAQRYTEEFFVTITPKEGVKCILYNYNAEFVAVDINESFTIDFVPGTTDTYIYLAVLEDTIYYESGYMWYHTLFIVLDVILLVVLLATIIIYKKKVWYFV